MVGYAILGIGGLLFAGAFWFLVRAAIAKDRAEQARLRAENNLRIERERQQQDAEIKELPDDELANRLNRWTSGVRPPD